ncbi:MAG: hypothetical protein NC350_04660 [Corallococcus sp.]|nr:hypothetical protein [Corallococcus sp.]
MTPHNVSKVKQIVEQGDYGAVIVSAVGSNYSGDIKVTDRLLALQSSLPNVSQFFAIEHKYRKLAAACHIGTTVDKLLAQTLQDITARHDAAYTASKGEELSAKIMAEYLGYAYVEAAETMSFEGGKLSFANTVRNLRHAYNRVGRFVMGGFYGGDSAGNRYTFTRGGSDTTGAIVANALNADLYENWTDVNGFCIADPRKISGVSTVRCMSYADVYFLARRGANVLCPDAVKPAMKKGIPINVRNILCPYDYGTLITYAGGEKQILGISEKVYDGKFVTTVLHNTENLKPLMAVSRALSTSQMQIYGIRADMRSVTVLSESSILRRVYDCLID